MRAIVCCIALLIIASSVAVIGGVPEAVRLRLQRITSLETADTVLDAGEAVYSLDEVAHAATLRIGDGERAGGWPVTAPGTIRASGVRALGKDEYAIAPDGEATWSGGRWELLPLRSGASASDRTGTITILTGHRIHSVTYDRETSVTQIGQVPADTSTGPEWVALTATEMEMGLPGVHDYFAAVSNIVVNVYVDPDLIGAVADLRHATTLVRGAQSYGQLGDDDALPKGGFNAAMTGRWGDDWWRHIAGGQVTLDSNPLRMSPTVRLVGGQSGFSMLYRTPIGTDREIMTGAFHAAESDTNATFRILQADLTGDPLKVWISPTVEFTSAPELQYRTNLVDESPWVPMATTTAWPETEQIVIATETWDAWLLTAAKPAGSTVYLRVAGEIDSEAVVTDYIEMRVADLRNQGTISARGFRWIDGSGTNFVAGTNGTYDLHGVSVKVDGGIVTEIDTSSATEYATPSAVTNIVMTSYGVPYDASGNATAAATNALSILRAWGSEVRYAGGTNAVTVSMADEWPQFSSVGMVSLAVSNSTYDVIAGDRIDTNSWADVTFSTNGWSTVSLRRNYGETLWYALKSPQSE